MSSIVKDMTDDLAFYCISCYNLGMLPLDPVMLLSVINMKLRDCYSSLDDLCEDMDVSRDELEERLSALNVSYDEAANRFF